MKKYTIASKMAILGVICASFVGSLVIAGDWYGINYPDYWGTKPAPLLNYGKYNKAVAEAKNRITEVKTQFARLSDQLVAEISKMENSQELVQKMQDINQFVQNSPRLPAYKQGEDYDDVLEDTYKKMAQERTKIAKNSGIKFSKDQKKLIKKLNKLADELENPLEEFQEIKEDTLEEQQQQQPQEQQ